MGKVPKISNAEWWILKELWKDSPQSAKQLTKELCKRHMWSTRTVKTLIHRLVKKGALSFVDSGREYQYSPAVTEDDCIKSEQLSLRNKLSKASSLKLITSFIEDIDLTHDQIEELRKLIEKKGEQK